MKDQPLGELVELVYTDGLGKDDHVLAIDLGIAEFGGLCRVGGDDQDPGLGGFGALAQFVKDLDARIFWKVKVKNDEVWGGAFEAFHCAFAIVKSFHMDANAA